jgi:glycosyltransferase involved in cell wall biosynthesis
MPDLLTIAMPVYERSSFFREALASALAQQPPVPVMVVDNASVRTDFAKILTEYPGRSIEYHRHPRNLGMHGNWNECIRRCRTPYVLILHDDDVLAADYVAQWRQRFDPSVDFFWCKVAVIGEQGQVLRPEALDYEQYQRIEPWCTHNGAYQGMIMRCTKAVELGLFNPRVPFFPDWDLYMKFMLRAKTQFLPVTGVRYRISTQHLTASMVRDYRYFASGRLQIKRNFARAGLWSVYRQVRFTGKLPTPTLAQILEFLPQLSRRRLAYFCRLLVFAPATTRRRVGTKWLIRVTGWRGVRALGVVVRAWRRAAPAGKPS